MKNFVVLIQENLLRDLRTVIAEQSKLKIDVAIYFLSLFNSLPTYNRTEEGYEYIVKLDSQRLKNIHSAYNLYINFFLKNNFISLVNNYSTDNHKCREYCLTESYQLSELVEYIVSEKILLKKFDKKGRDKKTIDKNELCMSQRPHLLEGFNEYLEIDLQKASSIAEKLLSNKYDSYRNAKQLILEFQYRLWRFSINPDTDNRLHTNLTRFPKVLRSCLTYDGRSLGEVDIQCSQPFFLCVILQAILTESNEILENVGASEILSKKLINKLFELEINKDEVKDFIELITTGGIDFYEEFALKLPIKKNEQGKIFRKIFNSKRRRNRSRTTYSIKTYDNKRDLAKEVIMQVLYGSSNSRIVEVICFKKEFPSVFKIITEIKKNVKLDRLLSNIESYCLLDVVAKKIKKRYFDKPLFSIHDSLITSRQFLYTMRNLVERELRDLTKLDCIVRTKEWV